MYSLKVGIIACATGICFIIILFILLYPAEEDLPEFLVFNNNVTENLAGLVFKEVQLMDKGWIKQLHEEIKSYDFKGFNYSALTKNVGLCSAKCNNNTNSDSTFYENNCKTFPMLILDGQGGQDSRIALKYIAVVSVPCFLKLSPSTIPGAGRGIINTKYKIPKGFMFGPYIGTIRPYSDAQSEAKACHSGYAWDLQFWYESFCIDGYSEKNSNYLRYINSARYFEEQNLMALIFNNSVYYIAYKDIEPMTELLVWYGYHYGKRLKIRVIKNSTYDTSSEYAPPLEDTICPTCPRKEGEERIDKQDYEENLIKILHSQNEKRS